MKSEQLYLDLLKKTLSYSLWPEPPIPIETFNYLRSRRKRFMLSLVSNILNRYGFEIVEKYQEIPFEERAEGKIWPVRAFTMIGLKRLDNLQHAVETVIKEDIEGDLIETGVWRGGAVIFMRAVLAAYNICDRKVIAADSFEGLPKADVDKYPADRDDPHYIHRYLAVSLEEVQENFSKFGLLDEQVQFLKGWFEETLPKAPIEKLSVLRLDGDMYGSTMVALENLYPKLSKGGFCIVDDYGLKGCKMAVDDFRKKHHISSPIKKIDWTGIYWRKD